VTILISAGRQIAPGPQSLHPKFSLLAPSRLLG
jgi:hypothetical protein